MRHRLAVLTLVPRGVTILALALSVALDSQPAGAADGGAVPGHTVERVSALAKNVLPGTIIRPTLALSQTTAFPIDCWPLVSFGIAPAVTVSHEDISARVLDPRTGSWIDGVQTTYPWGDSGEQVSFEFGNHFELQQTEKLTLHFEITFGVHAPQGYYFPEIAVGAVPVGAEPGLTVVMESVGEGVQQVFHVGSPETTEPEPERAPPPAPETQSTGKVSSVASATPTRPATDPSAVPSATPTPMAAAPAPDVPSVLAGAASDRNASGRLIGVAVAVGASWVLLIGGYVRRARRRRRTAGPPLGRNW
jgi:hypothetical protein